MKIKVIGCGNAFSKKNFNQSFLISENGRNLLVDCGSRIPLALNYHGISSKDIHDIYISHAHGDHVGGLEELLFERYDWSNKPRVSKTGPRLICNKVLLNDLWEHTLSGGMKSMEGFDAALDTFVIPMPIEPNESFMWEGWKISLIQQIHVMTGSVIMNAFGLFLEGKKNIFFTTDAQYFQPEQVEIFYDLAHFIFQDCECIGCDTQKRIMNFKSGVHANYAQLAGWPNVNAYRLKEKTRSKLWLSHYQDFVTDGIDYLGRQCDWDKMAKEDGFAGFVKLGQEFEI